MSRQKAVPAGLAPDESSEPVEHPEIEMLCEGGYKLRPEA